VFHTTARILKQNSLKDAVLRGMKTKCNIYISFSTGLRFGEYGVCSSAVTPISDIDIFAVGVSITHEDVNSLASRDA